MGMTKAEFMSRYINDMYKKKFLEKKKEYDYKSLKIESCIASRRRRKLE